MYTHICVVANTLFIPVADANFSLFVRKEKKVISYLYLHVRSVMSIVLELRERSLVKLLDIKKRKKGEKIWCQYKIILSALLIDAIAARNRLVYNLESY